MLFEEALILVGIPLVLVLIGFIAHRAELTVIGGIGLLVAGVIILASPLVVHYGVNYTSEQSYVWDGYCNVTDLFPVEYDTYADNYAIDNGVLTAGDITSTYAHDGTYLQIKENGANFNITFNFTVPPALCPTNMRWVGRYQGPGNRGFTWYAFNHSSGAYVDVGLAPVSASASDSLNTYGCPTTSDYLDPETGLISMRMVTTNSAAGNNYIYTDELLLYAVSTDLYAESTHVVNCTRDNYNVTYWYDGTELDPNNNMIIGLLIALFGLLGLVVGALTFRD